MTGPVIQVAGAAKRYVKYDDTPMLVTRLARLRTRTTRSALWAVRDATFDVQAGEVLGVIGRNGSGKSTLLRMLAGVTAPTEGTVRVQGRVAPLIAVGVGFHQELTGRENVYINGTVLGLTRRQIDRRFDEIVEFAEVADFIDTPVKFYSSGMFVRLGFAVSVVADPDVLIVDEVLSVGDMAFQLKCVDRMAEIQKSGTTIVVVSHNLAAVRNLCPRTIVMHDGTMRHDGDTEEAISLFHRLLGESRSLDGPGSGSLPSYSQEYLPRAEIQRFELLDADGRPTRHARHDEEVTLAVEARFTEPTDNPVLGLSITNSGGVQVYGEATGWLSGRSYRPGETLQASIRLRPALASGSYSFAVGLAVPEGPSIAPAPRPLLVYVDGRNGVNGVADLGAGFEVTGGRLPTEAGTA